MEFLAFDIAIYPHKERNLLIATVDWTAHYLAVPSRNCHDLVADVHGRVQMRVQVHV